MLVRGEQTEAQWVGAITRQVEALQQLLRSDGWKILDDRLKSIEDDTMNKLTVVQEGEAAMRLVGALVTVREARTFAERTLEAYMRELRSERR